MSRIGVSTQTSYLEVDVDADLDTLATAFCVAVDDLLKAHPERVPYRPRIGISPKITDAEVLTLALLEAPLGFTSEARWLRPAHKGEEPRPGFRFFKPLRQIGQTIRRSLTAYDH